MTTRKSLFALTLALLAGTCLSAYAAPESKTCEGRDGAWRKAAQGSPSLKSCQRQIAKTPQDALANNDLGWAYRQHGDLVQAEQYLRAAIKLKPDMGAAHSNLSVVLYDKGAYADSVKEAQAAVEIDQKSPIFRVVLGNALSKNNELKAAIEQYKQAVQLKPDYENALYNLGRALHDDGQKSEAQLTLSTALKYDAKDDRVLKLLDQLAGDTIPGTASR